VDARAQLGRDAVDVRHQGHVAFDEFVRAWFWEGREDGLGGGSVVPDEDNVRVAFCGASKGHGYALPDAGCLANEYRNRSVRGYLDEGEKAALKARAVERLGMLVKRQ
jgi:hypothetical protein